MSFLKKLFGLRAKTIPKVAPDETSAVVCCPICHSQKVTLHFNEKDAGKNTTQQSKEFGGCVFIESGSMKKTCQDCAHVWDETEFNTTACLMMKPQK